MRKKFLQHTHTLMERINLASRTRNGPYYDRSRDIETALAWNAIKKALHEAGREDLFGYIKSVKIAQKYITIRTEKPIVNEELRSLSSIYLAEFLGEKEKKLRFF